MCFYQPVSKLVMFEHQGGGIVFSMCLVFHLRDRTECDYSPIGGGPACPGYGPGCQTVGRHSLVARPSPSTPSPPHSLYSTLTHLENLRTRTEGTGSADFIVLFCP